jgi:putative selenate reductase
MSTFRPIPFKDLIRRVFYEYSKHGKIFGMPKEKFFKELPGVNLSINYMGKRASTPLGPAAGPHTQLAQNIVLAWLTGSRIIELKTVQILDQFKSPHPCIDTETIGFNVGGSQELRLEDSLREYVKAWMLIEIIKASQILGEEFSKHHCDTIFDLSIGYDFKGIKSKKIHSYIQELKNAKVTIESLCNEIPPDFSHFKKLKYDPQIIHSVTLSTFHGCSADEIDHIISYLLTEHQVNVIVKLNPTLLGQQEVSHILHDILGYKDLALKPNAFERDLQFDQAIDLTRNMFRTASSCEKILGLKFTNTLVVENHKGYLPGDEMHMSGLPLHVLAIRLLKKFRDTLGNLHFYIPTSFSAGVGDKNFADVVSLNLAPVTVCTDMLKAPGYEKSTTYLNNLGEAMESVGAINISDYITKRFDHAVASIKNVFDMLRDEVKQADREATKQSQLQVFDSLYERVLNAYKENSDSLELLTTDALIITKTLEKYSQKFGETFLFPHSFKKLYETIIAEAARHNLESVLYQTMTDPRYTYEKNSQVSKKLPVELGLYDCTNCGRCISVCPNNANFVYYIKPTETSYVNYQLTEEGVTEIEGGVFTFGKFYQVANFADCCDECSICGIHCVETGKPYRAKPKYFGSRERWAAQSDYDGFFVEKANGIESIVGRIEGKEYTLTLDQEASRVTFGDDVIEGLFEYPAHVLVKTTVLNPEQIGHILDMKAYHILLTQLQGVLNEENYNYVNIKYSYEWPEELLDIKGIITVLNTPFTDQNQIDLESLRKHVQYALASGVAGFLVPAMAGEIDKLTDEERSQIVKTVLNEVKQNVPVIGCASAANQAARLRYAQNLVESGCNGVMVNIPYLNEQQYTQDMWEIAMLNPGFLMVQDWDPQGYGIPVRLIQELFYEIDVFQAIKIEVIPAGVKYTQVLEATQGKLHVSGGWAVTQMIEALDRGVHAFMPTGMHEIYTKIYSLYQSNNRKAAQELFNKLLPVLAFSNQHLDISIQFFKRLLYKQGIYATPHVREPLFPFDRYHEKIADELIESVQEIITSLQKSD